ncbi:MAG: pyridoxal kinase [Hyphomonadaceae bacterium]|nr:pyridoxal kinase [Hyphomonadaceae bacterium]
MSEILSRPRTVLSIQSQVVGARVGNSVAAFAMERLGVRVLQLPTTLLGRRPDRGPPGGGPIPTAQFEALIEALAADGVLGEIDAVLSGYLGAAEQAQLIVAAVEQIKAENPKAIFVCDPVMGDEGAFYVSESAVEAIKTQLIPRADWLIPNWFELGAITGRALDSLEDAQAAAKSFNKIVLVTSVRTAIGLGNLYVAPTGDWFCETPRLPRAPKGAGDLFSALFVARRVRGDAPAIALEGATGGVYDVIVRSIAADSDDLLLPQAQEVLADPVTWPRARSIAPP